MTVHEQVRDEERSARERHRNLERARRTKVAKRKASKRTQTSRLREVEARMDALGIEIRAASGDARHALRRELRDLGAERITLRWGRPA